MKRSIIEFLATGFYVGKIRWAPGTWGTLVAVPIVWLMRQGGLLFYMAAALAMLLAAVIIADLHEHYSGSHDPGEFVLDEFVGFAITMTWLPMTWQSFVLGFALFRLLDILKPFPIRYLDERIEGGLGTVLDDAAAGVVANILLQIVYRYTPWLGATFHASQFG